MDAHAQCKGLLSQEGTLSSISPLLEPILPISTTSTRSITQDPASTGNNRNEDTFQATAEEVETYEHHAESFYQLFVALFGFNKLTGYMLRAVDIIPPNDEAALVSPGTS